MSALAEALRRLGAMLVNAAEALEAPPAEPAPWETAASPEDALRELRARYY